MARAIAVAGARGAAEEPATAERWTRRSTLPVAALLVAYVALVVKDAWLTDDAYITFRTVDNLLHGFGPTWNTDERVQAFTHPLWMLLLSGATALTRDPYWASLLLSFALSAATVALVAFGIARSPRRAVLALILLLASKAYLDFSTSGLENPLTHLLLAAFAWVYLGQRGGRRRLLLLAAIAGLATFNRMDTLLLYLPALAAVSIEHLRAQGMPRAWLASPRRLARRVLRTAGVLAAGFAPFLLWCLFALWYYGSLSPNTALAKLHSGTPEFVLLIHGVAYVASSFLFDPLLILILLAGLRLPFAERSRPGQWLALGALLYLAYILWIGGDYMAGRFLTAPFLVAVILLTSQPLERFSAASPEALTRLGFPLALAVIVAFALFTPNSRWRPDTPITQVEATTVDVNSGARANIYGITDERAHYVSATGLWTIGFGPTTPRDPGAVLGAILRQSGARVVVARAIGILGYEAGPRVHIIDVYALADPFLARLPAFATRIGHFERAVPAGYVGTWEMGRIELTDPRLARFYSKLQTVTQGNLFDLGRLAEIWRLNTGQYDYLLSGYLSPSSTPYPHSTCWWPAPPSAACPLLSLESTLARSQAGRAGDRWSP